MSDSGLTLAERDRAQMRLAIGNVETALRNLQTATTLEGHAHEAQTAAASFRELVGLLALEGEPERRSCPFCAGPIMRLATRCVHCWKKSTWNA